MATYQIPKKPGQCRVIRGRAGNPIVVNGQKGKSKVLIPCKTPEQAKEICERINSGAHNGTISA